MVRVVLKPQQGIKVGATNKYLFDPAISQAYDDLAKDWATKTDGLVESEDYSSKAYAIGGTGTETNNSKYYSEQAGISATNASTSETNAGNSATTAATKAGEASASATIATTQAGIATTKANSASNSATTATTQAGIATSKAGEAATSATNAGISETNAGNSATSASNSANSASASASLAQNWATKTDGTVDGVEYSAKYYAEQAAQQAIPSQTGHSGEYLTTDGSSMSWNAVDALPSQTGQSGKFLTTDGTDASWANVDALPSQTGQSGKYLTTDGSSASWATVSTTPSIDNKSITTNASDQLQTIGVINQNDTTTALKSWSGTKAQYDAIVTKDANTLYNITDDTDVSLTILEALYPVGSIYITTNATCPLSTLIAGSTWVLVGQDRVLQGAGTRGVVGTTLNESLPNITGKWTGTFIEGTNPSPVGTGAFSGMEHSKSGSYYGGAFTNNPNWNIVANGGEDYTQIDFDASRSSSTYQDNAPVQPDAYLVNIFRRTA